MISIGTAVFLSSRLLLDSFCFRGCLFDLSPALFRKLTYFNLI